MSTQYGKALSINSAATAVLAALLVAALILQLSYIATQMDSDDLQWGSSWGYSPASPDEGQPVT